MYPNGAGIKIINFEQLPAKAIDQVKVVAPEAAFYSLEAKDQAVAELLPDTDIVVGGLRADQITKAEKLRWLQISSAGVGNYPELLPPHVILTNGSGLYGVPIAEHVLAMMLSLVRQLPKAIRSAERAQWDRSVPKQELFESTCGVVGLGDIGTEVARRAKGLGMRVVATKRNPGSKPDFVDELWSIKDLDRLLAEADHVVVCLPGTAHTRHMLDARRLGTMKPGAYIYNVGRGSVIEEAALIEALQSGHLGGAGLDVFEKEPLPQDSPLWHIPNCIVTPHSAGNNIRNSERFAEIFLYNLRCFLTGQPMRNVVDREWGY